jgi:integrase
MARPRRHGDKWRVRPLNEFGKRESYVFDDYNAALAKLAERQHVVAQVKRGLRSPDPPAKRFGELCDYWEQNRAPQKRSGKHDESIIRCHLRPALGSVLVRDFAGEKGVTAIDRLLVALLAKRDKKTVGNIITLLVSMLRLAVDLNWLTKVPRVKKPKIRLFSQDFRYLRTDEEIARFLDAARAVDELAFNVYATAVYTGMRAGELAGLLWADVDFEHRLITVQRSYDGPTKAEDVRYVPILDPLLPVLRAWRLRCPLRHAFPNQAGTMLGRSARVFQEVLHRVLDRAGFERVERKGRARRYIVFHDLRHTFASTWVRRSGDLFKLQKILGHKSIQMTMRYAHLSPAEYATDYQRLADVIPTASAEVIDFPSRPAAD